MACEGDLTDTDVHLLDPSTSSHLLARNLGGATSVSLFPYIFLTRSHSLNTSPDGLPLVLRPHHTRNEAEDEQSLCSLDGSDAEMIAHVAFTEPVRVKTLLVHIGRGEEAPRAMKVWVNRVEGVGFDDVEEQADHDTELLEDDKCVDYPTRVSKFQSSNPSGGDRSRIFYLGALGEAKQLKKDSTPQLDVKAANAGDAPVDSVRSQMGGSQTTIR